MAPTQIIRRLAALTLTSAMVLGAAACVGDNVGADAAYSTDSFASPTEHGPLRFGAPNPAEFTEDNRFHSWTFTLTAPAEIDLATDVNAANLDTVMYLYRLGEEGWGSYINKNDDDGGLLTSRIARSLDAGEYRIKVKTTKVAMRGSFSVVAGCLGDGCPTIDVGECNGQGPADLPSPTAYTPACDATLEAILTTPTGVAPPDCSQALEDRALQYYQDYWNDVYSYDDMTDGGEYEPSVGTGFHPGAGSVVSVDLGGDEDAMDFVFDLAGNLLFYYQHNQSPDWAWFCPTDGQPSVEEPDEDCVMAAISHSDYDVQDVTEGSGTTAAGDTANLAPAVAAAVTEYVAVEGIASGASVTYDYALWAGYYTNGAEVTLSADGQATVAYVVTGDPQWGMTIVFRTDDSGSAFVCKEL
ncbi:MAG: hypothetical protein JRI68_17615 [Deltaproteobacteria bacterium]|nr:hypothetical protein [Deltaproteobacteria bacterium]